MNSQSQGERDFATKNIGSGRIDIAARAIALMLFAFIAIGSAGCSTYVTPPTNPKDPVKVYLTDQTIHSSVLLPIDDHGKFVEFAFADWNYAAKNHTWPHDAIGALFFSQQATFGRRYFTIDPSKTPMAPELTGISFTGFYVDRGDVVKLIAELDKYFDTGTDSVTDNGFVWRKVDGHYSIANSCNTRTKQNLRELHCEVNNRSWGAYYRFHDVPPPAAMSSTPALPAQVERTVVPETPSPTTQLSQSNRTKTVGTRW